LKASIKTEDVLIVGDAQILADFGFFDRLRVDDDDDFGFVLHLEKKLKFAVGLKARQNPGSMVIIEELAAEFE
jgi:hypothetical protein